SGAEPAHRLRMKVVSPPRGEISSSWDGALVMEVALDGPQASLDDWTLSLQTARAGRVFGYPVRESVSGAANRWTFRPEPDSDDAEALRATLQELRPGEVVVVKAAVGRAQGAEGFRQQLSFPLRMVDEKAQRLPLEPCFVLMEDPEYNRLVASAA